MTTNFGVELLLGLDRAVWRCVHGLRRSRRLLLLLGDLHSLGVLLGRRRQRRRGLPAARPPRLEYGYTVFIGYCDYHLVTNIGYYDQFATLI